MLTAGVCHYGTPDFPIESVSGAFDSFIQISKLRYVDVGVPHAAKKNANGDWTR